MLLVAAGTHSYLLAGADGGCSRSRRGSRLGAPTAAAGDEQPRPAGGVRIAATEQRIGGTKANAPLRGLRAAFRPPFRDGVCAPAQQQRTLTGSRKASRIARPTQISKAGFVNSWARSSVFRRGVLPAVFVRLRGSCRACLDRVARPITFSTEHNDYHVRPHRVSRSGRTSLLSHTNRSSA